MKTSFMRDKDIMIAQDVVTDKDLKRIMTFLYGRSEWKRAAVYDQGQEAVRDSRTCENIYITKQVSEGNSDFKLLDDEIFKILTTAMTTYKETHPQLPIHRDEGYEVNRYEVGQEFKAHIDFTKSLPYARQVSIVFYLNDDYEGGELNFPTLGIKLKPKAGDIVFFPSNYIYLHQSMPIISGTKYSIVTWLN